MENIIDLNNNYCLEIINNINTLPTDVIDISNLTWNDINKKRKLLLKIDFNSFNKIKYKRILRKLLFIKRWVLKGKIQIGIQKDSKILLGYIMNYNNESKE